MSKPDPWSLLERLHDPLTSPGERRALEARIASDPVVAERLETFRVLADWPTLEAAARSPHAEADHWLARLESEFDRSNFDREIRRTFPFVAAAALAAAIALAVLNLGTMQDLTQNTIDALFGLPQPTLEDTLLANL